MNALDCEQILDVAPEFALDGLSGDDRAAVIGHLEGCSSCQDAVSSLAAVSDRLLLLAPRAEPPPGFADRVVTALASADVSPVPEATPARRRSGVVAAVLVAASLLFGALVFGAGRSAQPALAEADMRAANGEVVGQVFVHRDIPTVLLMRLPGWSEQLERQGWPAGSYSVRVERDDGRVEVLPVAAQDAELWAITLGGDDDPVTSVAVIDSYGYVWCHGDLATT